MEALARRIILGFSLVETPVAFHDLQFVRSLRCPASHSGSVSAK